MIIQQSPPLPLSRHPLGAIEAGRLGGDQLSGDINHGTAGLGHGGRP
jgi:hypothetical protein